MRYHSSPACASAIKKTNVTKPCGNVGLTLSKRLEKKTQRDRAQTSAWGERGPPTPGQDVGNLPGPWEGSETRLWPRLCTSVNVPKPLSSPFPVAWKRGYAVTVRPESGERERTSRPARSERAPQDLHWTPSPRRPALSQRQELPSGQLTSRQGHRALCRPEISLKQEDPLP